jgi:RNA polymerase sigma factor (sigma-70 family)
MADRHVRKAMEQLRDLVNPAGAGAMTDGQALDRFRHERDELAFEVLLRRHGAMVLRVCRRVLRDPHDAEDAFQATFLLLVRKANSIGRREALAGWLYKVAYRAALRLRRQLAHTATLITDAADEPAPDPAWRDLRPVLDEEVNRLPEKYRTAVVLCYFEGMAYERAAAELGCPKGTLSIRLTRAREILRCRLARRGITLAAVTLAMLLAHDAVAGLPTQLVDGTVRAGLLSTTNAAAARLISARVAALVEGMAKAMMLTKLKNAAAVLLAIALLGTGAGLYLSNVLAVPPTNEVAQAAPPPAEGPAPVERAGDVYGDVLPAGAVARLGTLRFRHECNGVAYTRNSKFLISGGRDFRLWDADSGRQIRRYQPKLNPLTAEYYSAHTTISVAPDNKTVAVGCTDHSVRLWDIEQNKEIRVLGTHWEAPGRIGVGTKMNCSVCYSPDGKVVVSGGNDGKVHVWNPETGKEIQSWGGHQVVFEVAVAPNNKTLAVAAHDGLFLCEIGGGDKPRQLGNQKNVATAAFSPDGKYLAAGSYDETLRLFDVKEGKEISTVALVLKEPIYQVTFAPDGRSVAVVAKEDFVRTYEVATGKAIYRLAPWWGCGVAYAPNGKSVASVGAPGNGYVVRVFDAKTGKEDDRFVGHNHGLQGVAFLPDGKSVLSAGWDNTVRLWNPANGKQKQLFGAGHLGLVKHPKQAVTAVAMAPDGKSAAFGVFHMQGIHRLDLTTGKVTENVFAGDNTTQALSYSPDGKILASYHQGTAKRPPGIYLWDAQTGNELRPLEGATQQDFRGVMPPAFSADSKLVASGMDPRGALRIWDASTGKEIKRLDGSQARIKCTAFAPDQKTIAAAGEDRSIRIWNVESGDQIVRCVGHDDIVTCIAYSADGKTILSGSADTTVRLWDAHTGKELGRFHGHTYPVMSVAWSPDRKQIASASLDTSLLVWEVAQMEKPAPSKP